MSADLTMALVNNATLLLALSVIYEIMYIFRIRSKTFSQLLSGILIGLIGIAIMSLSFTLMPGLIFDTRSVLIGVGALMFGFIPGSVAAGLAILYRIWMGGIGMPTGIAVILSAYALGLVWRRFVGTKRSKFRWLKLYAFGICVHVMMLACMLLMPSETAMTTVRQIAFPVLVIYPVGVVLLSLLLLRQIEFREATQQAAEAESRYKSLFYNNHAVMLLIDTESGSLLDASPAAERFYGWSLDELKKMNIRQINTLSPEDIKVEMEKSMTFQRNYFLFKHNRAVGGPVDVEVYSGPIEYNGKTYLYSIVHDISERTAAIRALEESEARFRTLVDSAPDAIFLLSDKRFSYINKAGLKLLGAERPEQLLGQPGLSIVHPDYRDEAIQQRTALHQGLIQPTPMERVYIRPDGSLVTVHVIVVPVLFNDAINDIVFARDLTEQKRMQQKDQEMEAQLRQQQKLEAIGTLAGGVAHEINNPLNGVMNYAQLILDHIAGTGTARGADDSGIALYAQEIVRETERISTIVKNLLQFSRHDKQSHSYASIYDIVGQTVSLVNTIIKKDQIVLDIALDAGLPEIKCRSQQIQQVIMNLLTNARDAVNARYPGYDENKVIRLRCSEYQREGRRWLCITVLDNGCGIPPEVRARIFEPFFSTKPKELGTGLGLSISYGIVNEHHGKITFETEVGNYTKFIVELPVDNGWSL